MPNPYFTALFLTNLTRLENDEKPYDKIYFVPSENSDTAEQLREFKSSEQYSFFREQYITLLHALKQWCVVNAIEQHLKDDYERGYSAFDLLQQRLLGADAYYNAGAALLFSQGKKSLETVLVLLEDPRVSLAKKKETLTFLQQSIGVCADGTLTNILAAADDLSASIGINAQIQALKLQLIQYYALEYLRENRSNDDEDDEWEIHYVNTLCNYIATDYGILLSEDRYTNSKLIDLKEHDFIIFSRQLEKKFIPQAMILSLIDLLQKELQRVIGQFHDDFFKEQPSFSFAEAGAIITEAQRCMDEWNSRYSPIVVLDLHALIMTDDQGNIASAVYNHAFVQSQVAINFRALYLSNVTQRLSIAIDDGQFFYDNGAIWIEKDGSILEATPAFFSNLAHAPDNDMYYRIASELLNIFPDIELIKQLFSAEKLAVISDSKPYQGVSLLNKLAIEGRFALFAILLDAGFLTQSHLSAIVPSGPYQGQNTFCILLEHCQFSLVEKLVQSSLVTQGQLSAIALNGEHAGENAVLMLALNKRFELLAKLCCLNLISERHLSAACANGVYQGGNAVWMLAFYEQDELLDLLLEKNLLTQYNLSLICTTRIYKGFNSILLFVLKKQYKLLGLLLEKNLLVQEHLSAIHVKGVNKGFNPILELAYDKQYALLNKLLEKKLLTSDHLSDAYMTGLHQGKNTVLLLATDKQYELIGKLLDADLVYDRHLSAICANGGYKEGNLILVLALDKQYDLLNKLFKKNLLTQDNLSVMITAAVNRGFNIILALALDNQHDLLRLLLSKNLLTQENLSVVRAEGANKGFNAILALAFAKQYKLLGLLLAKNLLTQENLSAVALEGIYKGQNVALLLALADRHELLAELLERDLLTHENFSTTCRARINAITVLAIAHRFDLLRILLKKDFLTQENLSVVCQSGSNAILAIATAQEFDLLKELLAKGLLTQENLSVVDSKGVNAILAIATSGEFVLLEALLTNGLLTQENLLAIELNEKKDNKNALLLIGLDASDHFFDQLCQAELITRALLIDLATARWIDQQALWIVERRINARTCGVLQASNNNWNTFFEPVRHIIDMTENDASSALDSNTPYPN